MFRTGGGALPVLFNELDEEVVGWYKNSAGLKKPIYVKNVLGGGLKNNGKLVVSLGNDLSIEYVLNVYGIAWNGQRGVTSSTVKPIPFVQANAGILVEVVGLDSTSPSVNVITTVDYTFLTGCSITIYYTKKTDDFE